MGLFKKKKNEVKKEENKKVESPIDKKNMENNSSSQMPEIDNAKDNIATDKINEKDKGAEKDKIEILDLSDSKSNLKTSIGKKNDFRFVIYLFGIVIIFIFSMPTIRNLLEPTTTIQINKTEEKEEESGNLEHGYLVIDKDSFKRVENIKFSDFKRYEGNMIVFNYISSKTIRKVANLNIYVQVYDSTGTLVHKEKFNVENKITKNVEGSYSMNLSDSTYKSAYYIKVEVIEPKNYNKNLACTSENKNDTIKTSTEIDYNFLDNMLISYTYTQSFIMLDTTVDSTPYTAKYLEQYNLLKQTNIKDEDIEKSTDKIYYKIDYSYFDLGDLEFTTKYAYYDHYDIIIKNERKKGWTCE